MSKLLQVEIQTGEERFCITRQPTLVVQTTRHGQFMTLTMNESLELLEFLTEHQMQMRELGNKPK